MSSKNFRIYILLVVILITSGFLLTYNLDKRVLASRAEARTAVTAREMISSGDYIIPTLNANPRLEKPPLYYYFIAGVGKITGKVNEMEARLPSAISGLLTILILFLLSQKVAEDLYKNGKINIKPAYISFLTAAMFLTDYLFFDNARRSEVDVSLTFFITLSLFIFYIYLKEFDTASKRKLVFLLLSAYASIGFGVMTKGPIAIMIPMIPFWIIAYRSKKKLSIWPHISGFLIILLLTLPWVIMVFVRVNSEGNILFHEFLVRFTSGATHKKFFLYYLYTIFFAVFPWSIFLIQALIHWFKNEKSSYNKYLFFSFTANLAWLSVMRSKQDHYILPLLPIIPIFITYYLFSNNSPIQKSRFLNKFFILFISILIIISLLLIYFIDDYDILFQLLLLLISCYLIIRWIKSHSILKSNYNPVYTKSIILIIIMMFLQFAYIDDLYNLFNIMDQRNRFVSSVKKNLPINSKIMYYDEIDPIFVFYFGDVVQKIKNIDDLSKLSKSGNYYIIVSDDIKQFSQNTDFIKIRALFDNDGDEKTAVFHPINSYSDKYNLFHKFQPTLFSEISTEGKNIFEIKNDLLKVLKK